MSVIDLGHEHGLTLRQVEILHGARRILGPVSLGVSPGEVVTVLGPGGCGKSRLLAAVCGTVDGALSSRGRVRSEAHPSELQSLMRTSYDFFVLKEKHHSL